MTKNFAVPVACAMAGENYISLDPTRSKPALSEVEGEKAGERSDKTVIF